MNTEFYKDLHGISMQYCQPQGSANLLRHLALDHLPHISRRDFSCVSIGNRLLVRRDELLDWLERQRSIKPKTRNPKIVGSDE